MLLCALAKMGMKHDASCNKWPIATYCAAARPRSLTNWSGLGLPRGYRHHLGVRAKYVGRGLPEFRRPSLIAGAASRELARRLRWKHEIVSQFSLREVRFGDFFLDKIGQDSQNPSR
jgi:hypothetical protein